MSPTDCPDTMDRQVGDVQTDGDGGYVRVYPGRLHIHHGGYPAYTPGWYTGIYTRRYTGIYTRRYTQGYQHQEVYPGLSTPGSIPRVINTGRYTLGITLNPGGIS